MMIGQITKSDDGHFYAIQHGAYYIINRIEIRTGSESPITPHEKLVNAMADEIESLRTQLAEAEAIAKQDDETVLIFNERIKELEKAVADAQAEKAELVRRCAQRAKVLVHNGFREDDLYQAMLYLLPKE
jgi:hypothetical protein